MRIPLGLTVYLLALFCILGCGASSKVSKARLGTKSAYDTRFCWVGSNSYEIGESFLDEDGCNRCTCQMGSSGYAESVCTLMACY